MIVSFQVTRSNALTQQMSSRPPFVPVVCHAEDVTLPLEDNWLPMVACFVDFPIEIVSAIVLILVFHLRLLQFEAAACQLIQHPEYNSTLILRSEHIREWDSDFPDSIPQFASLKPVRCIRRKLLARRPERDASVEQLCSFYVSEDSSTPSVVVLTAIVEPGNCLPYYHPTVHHLALRYISSAETPTIRIEVQPLDGTPIGPDSRLYRTSLALLDTLHRYGWGAMTNYKKRVIHDVLVPRESYQDLYLIMRERHKHLINTWQEVTDPLKHVFEVLNALVFTQSYVLNGFVFLRILGLQRI